jgi:uncharacterized protein (DUF58 family)
MTLFARVRRRLPRLQRRSGSRIEAHQPLFIVVWIGALLWNIVAPSALAFTLVVAFGSMLLIGFFWARTMARRVTAARVLRYTAVQVGDALEESIALSNDSRLPVLWAEFVDRSNIPGHVVSGVRCLSGLGTETWQASAICAQRGVFTLGPWELHLGDPFGIFRARQVYEQHDEILVYPPLAALPPDVLPRRNKIGDRLVSRQMLAADTLRVTTTRPYIHGDSLRRVHWRTTARQNDLYVKVFEPEASSTIWLAPDIDAAVHLGEGNQSSFEIMAILLASLAWQLLNERLSVGLLGGARDADTVPPRSGQPHFWTILRALAMLQASPTQSLGDTLDRASELVSAQHSIVIVTPSNRIDWLDALKQLVANRRDGSADVILLDRASFGGADNARSLASVLREQGFAVSVVRREDVQPITGSYGDLRRWEFQTLATGRVIVRQTPREAMSL